MIGIARKFVDDATLLVPVHRALAALALALAGLAFFRRMLPASIALCLAAWAAFVPTQFDGLYEVHLVGAALVAVAACLATYGARRTARGAVLAVLLVSTLVRSELAAAALVWALACGVHEWRQPHDEAACSMTILRPYLLPVVAIVVTLAIGFAVGAWAPRFRTPKTTRHFCNAYALGVAERENLPRYPTWSNCKPILARDFGRADVGPLRAAVASPRALFRHFTWNLRLLSRSIELMLWGATGAAEGSDYYPVPAGSQAARVATIALLVGCAAAYRRAPAPLDAEIATRRHWGFVGLGTLLAPSLFVLLGSRARAPYLAPVGLAALLLVGLAIERLWRGARRRCAELATIAVLAAALPFVPPRYDAQYATPMSGRGQPMMTAVRRLSAHRTELASPSVWLAATVRPIGLCAYLSTAAGWCNDASSARIRGIADPAALDAELRKFHVTHAYLDESVPRQAVEGLEHAGLGWTRLGPPERDQPWVLLRAEPGPAR